MLVSELLCIYQKYFKVGFSFSERYSEWKAYDLGEYKNVTYRWLKKNNTSPRKRFVGLQASDGKFNLYQRKKKTYKQIHSFQKILEFYSLCS